MGYYYTQREEQKFSVNAGDVLAVQQAQRDAHADWTFEYADDGSIVAAYHGESKSYDGDFLKSIAPYVRDGSFLEMQGEDDNDIFRLFFRGGKMYKIMAQIHFPEPE